MELSDFCLEHEDNLPNCFLHCTLTSIV